MHTSETFFEMMKSLAFILNIIGVLGYEYVNRLLFNPKSIIFLHNMIYIFGTEYVNYLVFRNFSASICSLTHRLASVNMLYVKIFQAFALNNSFIDETTNNQLLKFTDNAPWCHYDIDYSQLFTVADKCGLHVNTWDFFPINSGMISVVFKLQRKIQPGHYNNANNNDTDNQYMIVKMKRKNIRQHLDEAIENLLFLVTLFDLIPWFRIFKISDVVQRNIDTISNQIDFKNEINNMELIRENCKNLKYVKIPSVKHEITELFPDVIVMEYIDGMKINQLDEMDYRDFAKQVIKFGIVTTTVHGVTHGDLHAGNILFIKDDQDVKYPHKLGIIDFGIVHKVDSGFRDILFDIFLNMFSETSRNSALKILNAGVLEPPNILQKIPREHYENIVKSAEKIINDVIFTSKKANQIQIYKFISILNNYLFDENLTAMGIRPSDNFVRAQLVLAMAHGVTLTLCKNDFVDLMDEVINELFHMNYLIDKTDSLEVSFDDKQLLANLLEIK